MMNETTATRRRSPTPALTLLALGVVYGDIGTSPLYALRETFHHQHGIPLDTENILGGLSAVFWALMIIVSLKYVTLINAGSAVEYFNLPTNRVIELGTQIEI
jgi:KUP system potassium uptake protein